MLTFCNIYSAAGILYTVYFVVSLLIMNSIRKNKQRIPYKKHNKEISGEL